MHDEFVSRKREATQEEVIRMCARCGEAMQEIKCKIVCSRCGAYDDCSDP